MTKLSGFYIESLSVQGDGKRLGFVLTRRQSDIYLGRLEAGGTRLSPPRRLTLDDREDEPTGWTADSKAVIFSSDRNGTPDIFVQEIGKDFASPLVVGPDNDSSPRQSPDGAWVLFNRISSNPRAKRLMRVPAGGGRPEEVMAVGARTMFECGVVPGSPCVLEERVGKEVIVSLLDPARGKGRELFRAEYLNNADITGDGKRLAMQVERNRIRVVSLDGKTEREVVVEGVSAVRSLAWAADGKGFYTGSFAPPNSETLLYVDLRGKARELWRQARSSPMWAVPSPDGKYLAIRAETRDSNVWTLEDF
ncbi:MAG: PD40 domain-containing protein [Acidobacteria bacterium]|nr:PD40 domain-containing protein [Acidobacteriota bacterium]MBI3473535.1 PD40 domain-containing protein [Candidatus Solibacter usitatus]